MTKKNTTMLDTLLKTEKDTAANWTKEELSFLTSKQLKFLGKYRKGVKVEDQTLVRFTTTWNNADRKLAYALYDEKESGQASGISDLLRVKGGKVNYAKDVITMEYLDGTKEQIPNAPIPVRVEEVYPYTDALATLISHVVIIENGEWTARQWGMTFSPVFAKTGVDLPALEGFAADMAATLRADTVWNGLTSIQRSALSGAELLRFMKRLVNRMSCAEWVMVNAKLANQVFGMYKKVAGGVVATPNEALHMDSTSPMAPMRLGGRPLFVTDKSWTAVARGFEKPVRRALAGLVPDVLVYTGNYQVPFHLPKPGSTIESVVTRTQKLRELCGSNSAPSFLFDLAQGHAGLPDEFTRRMNFLLSATLGVWQKKKTASIRISSVGDIPFLISSLTNWSKAWDKSMGGASEWKLFLASRADWGKVDISYAVHLEDVASGVEVFYDEGVLPSTEAKQVSQIDFHVSSYISLPKGEYVGYAPIYGFVHFIADKKLIATETSRMYAESKKLTPRGYAYRFGSAAQCRGVVSTFDSFALVGVEGADLVTVDLVREDTLKGWYEVVERAQTRFASRWLSPTSTYSPISNLLIASKKAVRLAQVTMEVDKGEYVAPQLPRSGNLKEPAKAQIVSKAFDVSDEEESEPDEEEKENEEEEDGSETGEATDEEGSEDGEDEGNEDDLHKPDPPKVTAEIVRGNGATKAPPKKVQPIGKVSTAIFFDDDE